MGVILKQTATPTQNMSTQRITDANGRTMGYIKDEGGGRQTSTNATGSPRGYYDPLNNKTFDQHNRLVGSGNLLVMLVQRP